MCNYAVVAVLEGGGGDKYKNKRCSYQLFADIIRDILFANGCDTILRIYLPYCSRRRGGSRKPNSYDKL